MMSTQPPLEGVSIKFQSMRFEVKNTKFEKHCFQRFEVFGKVEGSRAIAKSIRNIIPIFLAVLKNRETLRSNPLNHN